MKKREADFSVVFRHWLRANPMRQTCAFEVKQTESDSLAFSSLEEHQIAYGDAVQLSIKGVLIRVQGTNGEPDYLYLYRDPVYIVIKYPKMFCLVKLQDFVDEKARSLRKSLTSARAREISTISVEL